MLILLTACNNKGGNESANYEVEYEEIVVDETGNSLSKPSTTTDDEVSQTTSDTSSTSSQTSSDVSDTTSQVVDQETLVDFNNLVEIDICDDIIRGYLDAKDPTRQYMYLSQYDEMKLDHQRIPLKWKSDGSSTYKLYMSENADFSNAHVSKISGTYEGWNVVSNKTATICVPGKVYYWKVLGEQNDTILGGGKISIKNEPVRWIDVDGLDNVRDMGGWKTESGKVIKYGLLYRGGRLDQITDTGVDTLKQLGIKTDIDIRSTADWDSHGEVAKAGLKYYFIDTSAHYDHIFTNGGLPVAEVKENYPKIFELLADQSNYPIYLHCNFGNDRTGSMAFILNGLLGVNYEDLTRDYELTSYAFTHDRRWRGDGIGGTFGPNDLIQHNISNSNVDGRWGMMNKAFMESKYCTDGKLSTAIEKFLLDAGVKQEHIDAYKKIMLS